MSAAVGAGALIAAAVGTTVLGAGYIATIASPAPPAAPTVAALDHRKEAAAQRAERIESPSRSIVRTAPTPTHDPLTAADDFAEHLRTYAPPTPTPSPAPAGDEQSEQPPPTATTTSISGKTGAGDGLNWAALAACESGGDPTIVSSNGLWFGLYQFTIGTWQGVGGTGLPTEASAEEQTMRAQILYSRAGDGPWPNCGFHLYD